MNFYDLKELKRDRDGLYDLTEQTYSEPIPGIRSTLALYTVQEGEDMRLDKVVDRLYRNLDNLNVLCSVNRIDNPLNIKKDDELSLPPSDVIDELRFVDGPIYPVRREKKTVKQPRNGDTGVTSDSPVKLRNPVPSVTVDNDRLIIGKGLFDR